MHVKCSYGNTHTLLYLINGPDRNTESVIKCDKQLQQRCTYNFMNHILSS